MSGRQTLTSKLIILWALLMTIDFRLINDGWRIYGEKSGYLNIHTIYKASTFVINSSLPIRRSATDADIEIFGSDVVLR